MVGYNASDKQNMCCKYKYEFYQEIPPAAKVDSDTKPVELTKTSEIRIVKNAGATNEVHISAADTEENKTPDFMSSLSDSEKKDVGFYYSLQDMKNANYDQIKKMFDDNKFEVNAQNSAGISYLMMATFWGNKDMVKYLLENGANVELKDNQNNNVKNYLKFSKSKNPEISEMINSVLKK